MKKESALVKKFREILWGFCFLLVGFLWLLNVLEITNIDIFFSGWWTLFIIIPCFIGLFTEDYFGNLIGFLIGMALLSSCQGWITFGMIAKLIFPVVFILIGINILFQQTWKKNVTEKIKSLGKIEGDAVVAIFSKQELEVQEEYPGGSIETIFGGVELDLRNAKIKDDIAIQVCSIFGGVTLKVPKDVAVSVKSIPIFGGIESSIGKRENVQKTIYIEATAIFGGVEIK